MVKLAVAGVALVVALTFGATMTRGGMSLCNSVAFEPCMRERFWTSASQGFVYVGEMMCCCW